jgi:hypothetical protein
VLGVEAEVDEGVVAEGGGHEDVAAVAAVAAGGAALGNEFFTPESHAAVATVTGFNTNSCLVNKHAISSVQAWVEVAMLLILLALGEAWIARSGLVVGGSLFFRILADLTVIIC